MKSSALRLLTVLACWAPLILVAQESDDPNVTQKTLIDYYAEGGVTMHVLLAGLVITIALTLYLFMAVNKARMVPKKLVDQVNRTMAQRDIQGVYELTNKNQCVYSKCLSEALLKVNFDRDLYNKASMVVAAEDTLDQEETKVMVWINYLNTVSTLAPMIGLFGTVYGMIMAFDALAAGNTEPSDLAGGIGTAMLTTAGGLIVGIPAMFFYFFFRNQLSTIVTEIQKQFNYAIDVLSGEIRLEGASSPAKEATSAE
ncbi:MAG: MotA/TolQ/ExbB proton channel family protein [Verrucomicrobiota bacterium]